MFCRYPDFVLTDSGLQYKDLRDGSGDEAQKGSQVTIDWDGYTIGYYGRPFEARNKASCCYGSVLGSCLLQFVKPNIDRHFSLQTKGGAFVGDEKDFFKFKVGDRKVWLHFISYFLTL